MISMTKEEERIINVVKDKIYGTLSYTNQDYETILTDIISLFKGTDSLNTGWDNISESDIMFIFMSLLAAHKDILNYMIDYRTQEAFMSTAKEITSITRIANSFGFKLPGHKAGRARFHVTVGLGPTDTVTVNPFDIFTDDDGVTWTYLGATVELADTGEDSYIELFQGTANTLVILAQDFANTSKTRVISDRSIAIGNNYNANGCSSLSHGTTDFEEVNNLYAYNGLSQSVYALNVDPEGLVYIQLQRFVNLEDYAPSDEFTFKYIVTAGAKVVSAADITDISIDGTDDITLTLEAGSFYAGSNMLDKEDTKEAFKAYYASASSLVTLSDYKNYVLNIQKVVPGITKCLVIDQQDNTNGDDGDAAIDQLTVGVYALKEDNELLTTTAITGDEVLLLDAIDSLNVTGITPVINVVATNNLLLVPITVTLTDTATTFTDTESDAIKAIVYNYVMDKNIGVSITASELNKELVAYGYDNFYGAIVITTGADAIEYYEYLHVTDKDAGITINP